MVKKYVLPCLIGLMSLFCVSSLANTQTKTNPNSTSLLESYLPVQKQAVHDFLDEEALPDENLMVSVTSSTKTSMGQSFTLMFSTGGQGWCDSTTTFLLAPDDPDFDAYFAEFSKKTVEEREEITQKWENGEYTPVHFNSYVYSLTATSSIHDIVIPRSLTRNHIFNLDVSRLGVNLVKDWTNVTSITIPNEISEIYLDSFDGVPDTVIFNVEAEADLDGWAEGWNRGATVNYGYTYPEEKAEPSSRAGASKYGDEKQNFIIGWYPKEGEQKPLTLEFYVRNANGEIENEPRLFEFAPTTNTSLFECVGRQVNDYTKSLYCDIPLADGESVAFDGSSEDPREQIVLHNVFRTKTNAAGDAITEPDLSKGYNSSPKQGFVRAYDINDFIKCSFAGLSTFAGYTSIDMNIDISDANVYEHLKPNYYTGHLDEIKNGSLRIRYRLTSLGLCNFKIGFVNELKGNKEYTIKANDALKVETVDGLKKIGDLNVNDKLVLAKGGSVSVKSFVENKETDKNGNENVVSYTYSVEDSGTFSFSKEIKIVTPIPQVKITKNKGNDISFLIKDSDLASGFSASKIRSVSFVGLYVTLDLIGAKSQVARSNVITRFGFLSVMPYSENVKSFNVNALLIIFAIVYVVVFVAAAVGLYFFLKNKYKNDEFRRMKTKPYIIKSILFLVGSLVVVFDLIFIILRGTVLNNAIVVYNPADAFIIVLSVLSVIIVGYFAKYMVGVIKTNKERRRIIKLKLNEDVEDDGTN